MPETLLLQIDESMYDQTTNPQSSDTRDLIAELLLESSLGNIDWYQTTWEDLRKPLYSALAAMLYTFDQVFSLYCPCNFSAQVWQLIRKRYCTLFNV